MKKFKKDKSEFSEERFWKKIFNYAKQAGIKTIYSALLLFNAYRKKETPTWAKNVILGALGYFISPIDAIPDLTPFLGYTDDIGILGFGLVTIASYVDEGVRKKSREQLKKWFGDYNQEDLSEIDDKL